MGEAERNFRNMMSEQGIFGREQGSLQQWAKEQAKAEKERENEERRGREMSGAADGAVTRSSASTPATEATLAKILTKIQERPILVA